MDFDKSYDAQRLRGLVFTIVDECEANKHCKGNVVCFGKYLLESTARYANFNALVTPLRNIFVKLRTHAIIPVVSIVVSVYLFFLLGDSSSILFPFREFVAESPADHYYEPVFFGVLSVSIAISLHSWLALLFLESFESNRVNSKTIVTSKTNYMPLIVFVVSLFLWLAAIAIFISSTDAPYAVIDRERCLMHLNYPELNASETTPVGEYCQSEYQHVVPKDLPASNESKIDESALNSVEETLLKNKLVEAVGEYYLKASSERNKYAFSMGLFMFISLGMVYFLVHIFSMMPSFTYSSIRFPVVLTVFYLFLLVCFTWIDSWSNYTPKLSSTVTMAALINLVVFFIGFGMSVRMGLLLPIRKMIYNVSHRDCLIYKLVLTVEILNAAIDKGGQIDFKNRVKLNYYFDQISFELNLFGDSTATQFPEHTSYKKYIEHIKLHSYKYGKFSDEVLISSDPKTPQQMRHICVNDLASLVEERVWDFEEDNSAEKVGVADKPKSENTIYPSPNSWADQRLWFLGICTVVFMMFFYMALQSEESEESEESVVSRISNIFTSLAGDVFSDDWALLVLVISWFISSIALRLDPNAEKKLNFILKYYGVKGSG